MEPGIPTMDLNSRGTNKTMTNQIPINVNDFNDYVLTPSERFEIFYYQQKDGP